MLSKPTTFIIGAGSSFELNLPTGEGLQDRVARLLAPTRKRQGFGEETIWRALTTIFEGGINWAIDAERYRTAAQKIVDGMPAAASIDNFLHTHRGDPHVVRLGKLAIARAILNAESNSHLKSGVSFHSVRPGGFSSTEYQSSWYYSFIKMLTMGTLQDDPSSLLKNIKFIVFNYDRCLELVLRNTIMSYYSVDDQKAARIVSESVEIIHPYGSLGPLPVLAGDDCTAFGASDVDLVPVADRIKTFTEAVDSDVVSRARSAVEKANVLVFLGFGFLPQNVNLIAPVNRAKAMHIHATTYGFSNTDKLIIAKELRRFVAPFPVDVVPIEQSGFSNQNAFIDVENSTCTSLINDHRMRLMEDSN
jgi:hypothetical protein